MVCNWVIPLFSLGLVGSTEDDIGSGPAPPSPLSASLLGIQYRIADYGDASKLNPAGIITPSGPPVWVEQSNWIPVTSLGTAAAPSGNTDIIHQLWDTAASFLFMQYAGMYELMPSIAISGGTAPYQVMIDVDLDLAGGGYYASGDIAWVGPIEPIFNGGVTPTHVWPLNQNPSGASLESFTLDPIPNLSGLGGVLEYPITDDWDISTFGSGSPLPEQITGTNQPPFNFAGSRANPFWIGFDAMGTAYLNDPSITNLGYSQVFNIHIPSLLVRDATGTTYDVVVNQFAGSPIQMNFLLQ